MEEFRQKLVERHGLSIHQIKRHSLDNPAMDTDARRTIVSDLNRIRMGDKQLGRRNREKAFNGKRRLE